MSNLDKQIEMIDLLKALRQGDEKPGWIVLRALRALDAQDKLLRAMIDETWGAALEDGIRGNEMGNGIPDDWYIEPTGETRILDQDKVADELQRLRAENSIMRGALDTIYIAANAARRQQHDVTSSD